MKRRKWMAIALILVLLLAGCAPAPAKGTDYAPDDAHRLVLYTSHKEEVWLPIVTEFENRTGIWVDVVTGGTNEILSRVDRESQSPKADVVFGGGVESLASYAHCFQSYACADRNAIDPRFRCEDNLWTPFSALPVVLIYNTKLVSAGELTCWQDLRSPRFSGRIAFTDPAISGSCFTALVTYLLAVGGDREQALAEFAGQLDGRQLDSSAAVLTAVADGTDLVGITLEETALKRIAAGDNIGLVYPADGTSCVPDGSALVKGAPHEENAKRFLDFVSGRDVQQLLADQFCRRSVRADIVPARPLTPLAQIPILEYDIIATSSGRNSILSAWAFQFGREDDME